MTAPPCACGCGQSVRTDRRGRPRRYIINHDKRQPFLYVVNPLTGCWEWLWGRTGAGYGRWRGRYAHRVSYERSRGPIPAGLRIDHLCRNRGCVNPDHLEPVTAAVNAQRSPLVTPLSPEAVAAIRASRESHAATARAHGVSDTCVLKIRREEAWR